MIIHCLDWVFSVGLRQTKINIQPFKKSNENNAYAIEWDKSCSLLNVSIEVTLTMNENLAKAEKTIARLPTAKTKNGCFLIV